MIPDFIELNRQALSYSSLFPFMGSSVAEGAEGQQGSIPAFLPDFLRLKPPVQQEPRRRLNGPGLLCNLGGLEDLRGLRSTIYFA
jgi:hypothetical protein